MTELTGKAGFAPPFAEKKFSRHRAGIELIATVALAVALVIAATAVSIGMARAQALGAVGAVGGDGNAPMVVATILGFVMAAAGGLTAIAVRGRRCSRG